MSFNKFIKTHRAKLSDLDPDFAEFIENYLDDPDIQELSGKNEIENYLWHKEAHEDIIDSFLIVYDLYKRTERSKKER